jgi:DNA-directed RNA polymerase III subunit RPC3
MVLKVNHAQCTLALRSQRLEEMSESYLGAITGHVYGALLQVLEGRKRGRDDEIIEPEQDPGDEELRQPTATTAEVVELLDPDLDLSPSISGASSMFKISKSDGKQRKRVKPFDPNAEELGIKQEEESDDDDENQYAGYSSYADREKRLCLIEEHLKLLAEHSKGFCTRVGNAGHGEWRVNFPALTKILIQTDIDSTIMARFGKIHTRITRLLRERGRLDEKQVASFSMMRIKDVRVILTELQFAGLVEAQEVPKDTARTPARTIYLWIHDQERVSSILLQQTYQAMSRTFRRLGVERETYRSAIERAEMYPDSLSPSDRDTLMQWREIEEKLLMQVQRMDELVALLRDFSGTDTSLVS